jgi:excisionase family DNA binding protein
MVIRLVQPEHAETTMDNQRIAYAVPEFCQLAGIGRSTLYEEIKAGRIAVVKVGRRTLITAEEGRAWLRRLAGEAA